MASALLLLCFTHAIFGVSAQDLARPTLTAHPSVITKTDSVTLNCRPPPLRASVPVSRCHFYTTDGQIWPNTNCLQSVRGSDLLREKQKPPAQVQVKCYYVVHWGQTISSSDPSDPTPVTVHVQNMKPGIILQAFDTEVIIACYPPPSASGCKCHLYFGESTQPHSTVNSTVNNSWKMSVLCQFYVSKMDFVTNFHKLQRKVVSCDYTLGTGPLSLSPRSEQKDLTVFMRKYYSDLLNVTSAPSDPETTTDPQHETGSDSEPVLPVHTTAPQPPVTSAPSDPETTTDPQHEPVSSNKVPIWLLVMLTSCGLLVGSVLTIMCFFCSKWIKADSRTMNEVEIEAEDEYDDVEDPGTYTALKRTTDVYATIHDQPSATPMENINLSTV